MADETSPITVATPGSTSTITTTTVRRRPWKILALNIASAVGSTVLLVLGYLQTINLGNLVSPQQALAWTVAINVLTIILRQFFSPPSVTQITVQSGDQG